MKHKFCLLLGLIFTINSCAYANSIVQNRFPKRNSAIQSTNINLESVDTTFSQNSFLPAIQEVKNQLSINPTDYSLNINLANLYLKSNEFENAFNELVYLNKLKEQKKLDSEELDELKTLYATQKNNLRVARYKSNLYTCLAILALLNNDNLMAETYINEMLNTGANSKIIAETISLVYSSTQNKQKGIEACDKIVSKYPNDIKAREIKAKLLLETNNTDEAINEYIILVGLNHENNDIKYRLYKLLESKNYSEDNIVTKLYSAYPIKKESAYYDIATILLENNDIEAAKYFADILAKSKEGTVQGNMLLAEIYRKQGNLKESYNALNEVKNNVNDKSEIESYNVQLAKLSNNPIEEAKKLNKQGLHNQALKLLEEQNQNDLSVILETASAYFHSGDKKSALEELNKGLSLYPNKTETHNFFAYIYMTEKDFETARKYLDEANKINPNNKQIANSYKELGILEAKEFIPQIEKFIEQENYNEATRLVDDALKTSKNVPQLYFYKALTQIAQNNYAASTANLYKCIELEPRNYLAYFYLAIAFDNLSEYSNAKTNYQKFVNLVPKEAFEETERINYAKSRIAKL
ncbi:MAG: tetratricopeptide repeat protein [Candidatus Gastranaerophilales bacterium]|nr:tetratricopeptide repeat protein [Candidatus Gastranaerophilales bacterium]